MTNNLSDKIGCWSKDKYGLPCFEYTGDIPYTQTLDNGEEVMLPQDPWFLLGNYHLTLFTHVSGEYQLISGQRSWGRLNQNKHMNSGSLSPWGRLKQDRNMASGSNSAYIEADGKLTKLTGLDSIACDCRKNRRSFGCGWVQYEYRSDETYVKRLLSVKPSMSPYDGTSAFLLTVTVKNCGNEIKSYTYKETMGVNYREIQFHTLPESSLKTRCIYKPFQVGNLAAVKISCESDEPMKPGREELCRYEYYPPSPFMCDISAVGKVSSSSDSIWAEFSFELAPQEEKRLQLVIGFAMSGEWEEMESIISKLDCQKDDFGDEWLKVLPKFETETDENLARELVWHAYCLEAMATYSEYYNETKIPQGTIYDYFGGQHASARDNFQHALPLCYYNPPLAKSVIRYMLKRTTSLGEIRLIEMGNGFAYNERYFTSDQQLYFFMLITEYLEVTEDYEFLSEEIMPYPAKNTNPLKVWEFVKECFVYLRDTVGTGAHGLINLLNSDWSDAVYYVENVPYNMVLLNGESHMNTAMALSILDKLAVQLKKAADAIGEDYDALLVLADSMISYREKLLKAFMYDFGDRSFPRRMYFNSKSYGDDNMFLEPMGFTLQIKELPLEKKRIIYDQMQKRLYKGEIIGAREQEKPQFDGNKEWYAGSRENGGFWYSLNGPVIIGVGEFDKPEAMKLLNNMTLENLSRNFPHYWSSYWSSSDTLESSLVSQHGIPYWCIPVYCAHPHAWILYCYYKIKE